MQNKYKRMLLTGILLLFPIAQQISWICKGGYRESESAMLCIVWFAMNSIIAAMLAESFYPTKFDNKSEERDEDE